MPKVACLDKFKRVLVGIPEIHGFPLREGRTFRIKFVEGMAASFDLLRKKRVQNLVVECCQNLSMQQILVGLPMDFGRDQLEMVVARAMFGFSRQGICCGLGGCTLYVKNIITSRVQELLEEFKKGGSEGVMAETSTKTRKQNVPYSESWNKLIDHLVGEKDVRVGEYWGLPPNPHELFIKCGLFPEGHEYAAKTFLHALIVRGLAKRIGPRNGRGTRWQIYNLPWPDDDNGKTTVTEAAPAPENSGPPLDLMVSALENVTDTRDFSGQLEKVFGGNYDIARAFAEKCGKQIELLEKVKRATELYADFTASMKSL